ncbi:MAG TPA: HAMP domain-containing sensor histidine kinase [Fluviicoccus sp.]|nr:HAMP domain-containing sensor histidine kinase [Fluviicoccus sp.]
MVLSIISSGFYFTVAEAFSLMDRQLINRNLVERMALFMDSYTQYGPDARMPEANGFKGFIENHPNSPPLPDALKHTPQGAIVNDLYLNKRYYHALHEEGYGRHFYLLLDDGPLETVKRNILLVALTTVSAALLISLLVAGWLAKLVSRPVTALANAVNNFNPEKSPLSRLGDRFQDEEVAAIANAFDGVVDRLTTFISREQAFTEDASHELRTPLAIILSSLQLMADDKSISISGQTRLGRIQRAAENMQSLINALLWISREDSSSTMPSVELGSLSKDLVQQFSEQMQRKPVTIEYQNLSSFPRMVPNGMAASIISNLLINALNHTEQGRIELILTDTTLTIRDTGIGINAEDIPHIFERRYRGGLSRGQGLGLYIVSRICQHLRWDISVSSAPGKGTCFTIRLPVATNG